MNERATVLLLALGVLFATFVVFAPKTERQTEFARPLSTDVRPDGLSVAAAWLRTGGYTVRALRARYSELEPVDAANRSLGTATGSVLITHAPYRIPVRRAELGQLRRWVERGNTLVVVAALADTPGWSGPGHSKSEPHEDVLDFTGLAIESHRLPAGERATLRTDGRYQTPVRTTLAPLVTHPYFAHVHEVVGLSDYPANGWALAATDAATDSPWLVLARTAPAERSGSGAWVVQHGSGRIIVIALGSVFTNRAIGLADNAALLGGLVAASVGPRGTVWFDDAHQGASTLYNAEALAADPRLYATIGLVLALWFAWVLGQQRLAAPRTLSLPNELDLIRSSAGLLDRAVTQSDAVRLMLERFLRRHAPRDLAPELRDTYSWAEGAGPGAAAAAATLRNATLALRSGRQVRVVPVRQALVVLEELLT